MPEDMLRDQLDRIEPAIADALKPIVERMRPPRVVPAPVAVNKVPATPDKRTVMEVLLAIEAHAHEASRALSTILEVHLDALRAVNTAQDAANERLARIEKFLG